MVFFTQNINTVEFLKKNKAEKIHTILPTITTSSLSNKTALEVSLAASLTYVWTAECSELT